MIKKKRCIICHDNFSHWKEVTPLKKEEEKFKRQRFQKVFSQAGQLLEAAVEQEKVWKTKFRGGTAGTKQSP